MMIDFALDAEREQGLPPEESIYQACRLRFRPIMMTTMAALLGRAAARAPNRQRRRVAPTAWNLHCGRVVGVAVPYPLHDSGHLPLYGSIVGSIWRRGEGNAGRCGVWERMRCLWATEGQMTNV